MSQKSKEIIAAAFWEILQNSSYEDITISEILANTPLVGKHFTTISRRKTTLCSIFATN